MAAIAVVATNTNTRARNAIGTHGGSYTVYRALSIAKTIKNPWLIVECLGLRARLLAETTPDDQRIGEDINEVQAICDQSGVVSAVA